MSYLETYQKGSFRGVPFRTESHTRNSGRRVSTHEFPGRDDPVTEDLGRRAAEFSISCHVIGSDYTAARDALNDALDAYGPGLLIHPWLGRMMVNVIDAETTESTEDGGVCWFRITFGEAGLAAPSPIEAAAGNDAAAAADIAIGNAPAQFAGSFSIDGAAAFVEDAAAELVNGTAGVAQVAAGINGGVGPALRAFDAGLRFLPDNISGLLRAPLQLGLSLVGLVSAVSSMGGNLGRNRRIAALQIMLDWEPVQPVFPVRTPQRQREADNRTALLHVFRTAVAAELVRTASAINFTSYDDAIATRDTIAVRLDALALAAADSGDDNAADVFDGLRRAMARDIAARGESLARVYSLELATTQPALVIAHRLYGGTAQTRTRSRRDLTQRAASIAARNGIAHPGFVPAGEALELLTLESGNGHSDVLTDAVTYQ